MKKYLTLSATNSVLYFGDDKEQAIAAVNGQYNEIDVYDVEEDEKVMGEGYFESLDEEQQIHRVMLFSKIYENISELSEVE